jgi:glycosyltransferase involved in cell wall biosynthesis
VARILIVAYTHYYQDGRVKRNAEALAERGDQVDVICLADGPAGLSPGVNVIALAIPRYRGDSKSAYLGSYLRFFAMASVRATRLSRGKPYDVVIVCTMPDAAVLCALGPKFYGARVVLDVHDTMPELYRDKFNGILGALGGRLLMVEERASAWFADRVLAVHELHRQRLARAGVPARKLSVVMNLPDRRFFGPPRIAEETSVGMRSINGNGGLDSAYGLAPEPAHAAEDDEVFRLVCHGTVTFRLGLDLAVRAVGLVRKTIPSVHLHVIGEGDFLPAVQELAKRSGLERHVTFTPPMAVEQLPPALTRAAVGIVPNRASRATHLMLPAKLLEYATLGIPVIAARLHTVEYYFPAGTVRYFEPGDVQGLAAAIEDLYRHPEKRRAFGRRAAAVASNLSWEHQRSQLFDTVDSLLVADTASARYYDGFRPMTEIGQFSQAGGQSCDTAKL